MYISGDTGIIIVDIPYNYIGTIRLIETIRPTEPVVVISHLKLVFIENGRVRTTRILRDYFAGLDTSREFDIEIIVRLNQAPLEIVSIS